MDSVFIVDDERLIVKRIKIAVDWEKYGFEVIGEAYDGMDAYDMILEAKPKIVFTDIRMPGMSGLELIKKVNEIYPDIQFVVISGYGEFAYAQKALNYGVLGYCLKPFDEQEIIAILEKARNTIDMARATLGTEFLTLVEEFDTDSCKRKNEIIESIGFRWDEKKGFFVMALQGEESLELDNSHIIRMKTGRRKYVYVIEHDYYYSVKENLPVMIQQRAKSIGISSVLYSMGQMAKGIEEANIAACQIYMSKVKQICEYRNYEKDDINQLFLQLENAIDRKDEIEIMKAFDDAEKVVMEGECNIKHAFQLYNIVVYSSQIIGIDNHKSILYNYEQLTGQFEDCQCMLEYLKDLLTKIMKISSESQIFSIKNETFRNILAYVNKNYCEDISIQTIVQEFVINPSYVSQLFKKEMKITFTEYLTNIRVNYAGQLLKTTDLPINEVAEKSGFNDYFYFTRVFKKTMGKTPTVYRDKRDSA
jgi:Response regulator containing CheY-like receiver domain and AraC-type DNA-binding domain